jgi:hypothetical protein
MWYHGTRAGFTRGGYLFPRSAHGGPPTTAPLNPGRVQPADAADYVYITDDPLAAWVYAWHAPGRGTVKVLTVEPCAEVTADVEHGPGMAAFRTTLARVAAVSTVPLVSQRDALTGWVA